MVAFSRFTGRRCPRSRNGRSGLPRLAGSSKRSDSRADWESTFGNGRCKHCGPRKCPSNVAERSHSTCSRWCRPGPRCRCKPVLQRRNCRPRRYPRCRRSRPCRRRRRWPRSRRSRPCPPCQRCRLPPVCRRSPLWRSCHRIRALRDRRKHRPPPETALRDRSSYRRRTQPIEPGTGSAAAEGAMNLARCCFTRTLPQKLGQSRDTGVFKKPWQKLTPGAAPRRQMMS